MGAILAFLTGWFARFLGAQAIRFLAIKAILYVLFVSILPVIIYNVLSKLIGEFFTIAQGQVSSSGVQPFIVQLTGFTGWLAIQLKIPQAFSIIISSAIFRVAISFIPFIGRA